MQDHVMETLEILNLDATQLQEMQMDVKYIWFTKVSELIHPSSSPTNKFLQPNPFQKKKLK